MSTSEKRQNVGWPIRIIQRIHEEYKKIEEERNVTPTKKRAFFKEFLFFFFILSTILGLLLGYGFSSWILALASVVFMILIMDIFHWEIYLKERFERNISYHFEAGYEKSEVDLFKKNKASDYQTKIDNQKEEKSFFQSGLKGRNTLLKSIGLIGAVFSLSLVVYSIICSVFATVIAGYEPNGTNFLNPHEILGIAQEQIDIRPIETSIDLSDQTIRNNVDFLFFIDQTASIKFSSQYGEKIDSQRVSIIKDISRMLSGGLNDVQMATLDGLEITELTILYMIEQLKKNREELGDSRYSISCLSDKAISTANGPSNGGAKWSCLNETNSVVELANQLMAYRPASNNYKSNFVQVMDHLVSTTQQDRTSDCDHNGNYDSNDVKNPLYITIVSDFFHDDTLESNNPDIPIDPKKNLIYYELIYQDLETKILKLANDSNLVELSLIKVPSETNKGKLEGERLFSLLKTHFKRIPKNHEKFLNTIHLEENEFLTNLQFNCLPTSKLESYEAKFTYTKLPTESAKAKIILPKEVKLDQKLVFNLKTNFPQNKEALEVKYQLMHGSSAEIKEENFISFDRKTITDQNPSQSRILMLEINNVPQEGVKNLALEVHPKGTSYKLLLPFKLVQKVSSITARMIWVSAIFMLGSIIILAFISIVFAFHINSMIKLRNVEKRTIPSLTYHIEGQE